MRVDTERKTDRDPYIALIASLIVPGAGQIYAGQWRRGLTLLLGLPVQAALFYGVGLNWLLYWMALVWLWNGYDAFMAAHGRRSSAFIPVMVLLALNLYAACTVTDIHMPKLDAEQRHVMGEIAGGVAKPDFVIRDFARQTYTVPGPGVKMVPPAAPESGEPVITLEPVTAVKGAQITVTGQGYEPDANGVLLLRGERIERVGAFRTDSKGQFHTTFTNSMDLPANYEVEARANRFRFSETLKTAAPSMLETIYLALLGTGLSLIFAIPLSFFGARNLMSGSAPLKLVYGLTRGLFTILRSVEVLIFAVIAVAAVGIGPFAGVIALAVHGVGALGKLYSESIESIEHGPIEAIRSTGASELQVVTYGVVPQVVPQFIAFTLYRWDINVRMATVIGLVGGGGIGAQLIQYMQLLQWSQAATAIWMIAGVVMVMDYASAIIREKVI